MIKITETLKLTNGLTIGELFVRVLLHETNKKFKTDFLKLFPDAEIEIS